MSLLKKTIIINLQKNSNGNGSNTSMLNGNNAEKGDIYLTINKFLNSDEKELISSKLKNEIDLEGKIELCFETNNDLIEQLKTEISRDTYDIDYMFTKWKYSFNSGYKTKELFTKIITFIPDITLDKMKENTAKLSGKKVMKIY